MKIGTKTVENVHVRKIGEKKRKKNFDCIEVEGGGKERKEGRKKR